MKSFQRSLVVLAAFIFCTQAWAAAIKDEVLAGLQLREPPPEDMPVPIVMRLNARRPN